MYTLRHTKLTLQIISGYMKYVNKQIDLGQPGRTDKLRYTSKRHCI